MEKGCNICKATKPVAEFLKNGKPRNGIQPYKPACKKCRKRQYVSRRRIRSLEEQAQSRARNKEKARIRRQSPEARTAARAKYQANRERVRAYSNRLYRERYKESTQAARILRLIENPELRERQRQARRVSASAPKRRATKNQKEREKRAARTPEQIASQRARDRVRYHEKMKKDGERENRLETARATGRDRSKVLATARKWRENNASKSLEYGHRYRARKAKAQIGQVSFDRILERDGMHCYLCDNAIEDGDLSFDHVIPLARGGAHSEDNLKPAHKSCNFRKWKKLPHEIRGVRLKLVS